MDSTRRSPVDSLVLSVGTHDMRVGDPQAYEANLYEIVRVVREDWAFRGPIVRRSSPSRHPSQHSRSPVHSYINTDPVHSPIFLLDFC